MIFGDEFNQRLENTTLPDGLRTYVKSLTFGADFNQRLGKTNLPSELEIWNLAHSQWSC